MITAQYTLNMLLRNTYGIAQDTKLCDRILPRVLAVSTWLRLNTHVPTPEPLDENFLVSFDLCTLIFFI